MEQEPERELLSDAIKRLAYTLRLATHLAFIILAFILAGIALASLFLQR